MTEESLFLQEGSWPLLPHPGCSAASVELAETSCAQGRRSCFNSSLLGPKICTYSLTHRLFLQVCQVLQGPCGQGAAHTRQGIWHPL